MKKGSIIALIVAAVLILSGGVILVLGLSFAGEGMPDPKLTERTVPLTETFDYLSIVTEDCDVSVALVQSWEEARVEFAEYSQAKHTVTVQDQMLRIELTDHRKWFDKVGVFWEDMQIRVYLPVEEYVDMNIITATGDIEMPGYLKVGSMSLYTDTGDVYSETGADSVWIETDTGEVAVCACDPGNLHVKTGTGIVGLGALEGSGVYTVTTDTGRIDIHNVTCATMTCESDTGDVNLWLAQAEADLRIVSNTGEVTIGNSNVGTVNIETDTGDVELEDVLTEGNLQILTDTGDVKIQGSDAGTVSIETHTGDVSGSFLTAKCFQAHSDTGKVEVPHTQEGGECRIESDTGDIHFQ